ncbi:hypothetical protein VNO78_12808 [Psophocarpus tetragonolobus]|uniref:Sulfotransferase n=1 Tax=Psophocarpus tetragonolobus TaxID=3891 RepID=A0AAN9XPH9_PSOTE
MAATKFEKIQSNGVGEEAIEDDKLSQETKELILSLPREKGWVSPYIYLFEGFWGQPKIIQAIITFQKHFQANDSDVLVATLPKSGTTWLKALTFATVNRHHFSPFNKNHPLLTFSPHDMVPFFEYIVYAKQDKLFVNKIKPGSLPTMALDEAFEKFCNGVIEFSPFWTNILGYWKESIERPNKVLFLMYEDLKEDVKFHLKRVAEFLDCPFTLEEESSGVIENIIKLCSFEYLKELEVNKFGIFAKNFQNKFFFRKGEIGDWVNYLSSSMAEKLTKVIEDKLSGSGLSFRMNS